MTDQDAPQRDFKVQRIYTKDMSFETPNSPLVFQEEWEPEMSVHLDNNMQELGEGVYEVVLTLTLTASLGEKTAYLAEVQQAGIFNIVGFEEEERRQVFGIHCPTVLFPYAREVVSDLIQRATFPQFVVQPVDFASYYAQHAEQQATH